MRAAAQWLLFGVSVLPVFAAEPVLKISGVARRDGVEMPPLSLTAAELVSMPRATARVKNREGKERVYEGVLLSDLLKRAGQPFGDELRGSLLSKYVLVMAHDGYRVLFSLPEIDPAFSEARVLVADKLDGQPLPEREGPLRLVIPSEKREARWIRMVETIEVAATPQPIR